MNGEPGSGGKLPIAAAVVIVLIVGVGVCAMFFGPSIDDPFDDTIDRIASAYALDYYHCPQCNTIVPCSDNHSGAIRACPSCGLQMNLISKRWGGGQANAGINAKRWVN